MAEWGKWDDADMMDSSDAIDLASSRLVWPEIRKGASSIAGETDTDNASMEAHASIQDDDDSSSAVVDGLTEIETFTEAQLAIPAVKYEYLDHTADVQLHAWGDDLKEAFEQCATSMFAYMTDISTVEIKKSEKIIAEGDDMLSLLFHFLDEFLYVFSAEPYFIARKVEIVEFDREAMRIVAKGYGETFDLTKHPQGTEVKAITYSNMQVWDKDDRHDVFVIIDI